MINLTGILKGHCSGGSTLNNIPLLDSLHPEVLRGQTRVLHF